MDEWYTLAHSWAENWNNQDVHDDIVLRSVESGLGIGFYHCLEHTEYPEVRSALRRVWNRIDWSRLDAERLGYRLEAVGWAGRSGSYYERVPISLADYQDGLRWYL